MAKKNPLASGLNYGPTAFRPIGQVYAAGSHWKPAPFPNGAKKASPPQKKK